MMLYVATTASKLGWPLAKTLRFLRELDAEHRLFSEWIDKGLVRVVEF